jgi:hypothetical protein
VWISRTASSGMPSTWAMAAPHGNTPCVLVQTVNWPSSSSAAAADGPSAAWAW